MDILIDVVLPLSLAFIMFSLGVGLTPGDFGRVFTRPIAFVVGALNQVVLVPVVAFVVIWVFGITGVYAVGIMVLAACPGGVTSNVIARYAKADVALSVTLTAVISLTSVITVPMILGFAYTSFMGDAAAEIDITGTAATMFALTVVPVLLGVVLRLILPTRMKAAESRISLIATVLFVLVVVGAVAGNWDAFTTNLPKFGPALVTLLVVLTAIGFFVPRAMGQTRQVAKTISVETGVQNAALGITVTNVVLADGGLPEMALPIAVYGIVMYLIVIPVLLIYRRI